nr:uncharacterized protein LOC106687432 [Halyomorpha halys]
MKLNENSVAMKCPKPLVPFLLWIWIPFLCQSQEQFAGPYQIIVRQVAQCDDSGTRQIYATGTRINRVSRNTYIYSTKVTTEVIIDDNIMVELDMAWFGNGGWRPNFMNLEFPGFCTSTKEMMPTFFNAIYRFYTC